MFIQYLVLQSFLLIFVCIFQQINVLEIVHLVSSTVIQTHDLAIVSLLLKTLNQGSIPTTLSWAFHYLELVVGLLGSEGMTVKINCEHFCEIRFEKKFYNWGCMIECTSHVVWI